MTDRVARLQAVIAERGADALWLTFLPEIRWACGFTGSNGLLIVRRDEALFVSDGRYSTQATQEVTGARVHVAGYDLAKYVAEKDLLAGCEKVVFGSDHLTVSACQELKDLFPDAVWSGEKDLLVKLVAAKEPDEVARIRSAQQLTETVYRSLLEWIRPGLTEKEVAAETVYRLLKEGAEAVSFDPIVASGPNSALPHARPTSRTLEIGDVVLLDFGCFVDGYASDMTRTIVLGRSAADARDVYHLVLAAQEAAVRAARAGMPSKDLDAVARDVIREGGFADYFTHGLGHGVGLQIHEWPRVSYTADYSLPEDCVVSIEPGIYLPERFGVRIEDLIVLRENGCEVITGASKEWTVV